MTDTFCSSNAWPSPRTAADSEKNPTDKYSGNQKASARFLVNLTQSMSKAKADEKTVPTNMFCFTFLSRNEKQFTRKMEMEPGHGAARRIRAAAQPASLVVAQ